MKIGIDARLYSQTGVGTYLQNFIYQLEKLPPNGLSFYIYLLPEDMTKIQITNKNFIIRTVTSRWHTVTEQTFFLKILYDDNLDLMHFTYFSSPIFYQRRFMATIHDTTPLLFKTGKASTRSPIVYSVKHFFFMQVLANQIKNAQQIITPTVAVKNQLIRIYSRQYENKIHPIHEGVSEFLVKAKENISLKNKFKDFFIYVGNFYPHKNIERLIEAFSKANPNASLILIGPNDYFAKRLKLTKNIILYPTATKEDLVYFYKRAKALIHPSLSEGFGLPIIEAAYFNCPIIASNIDVFKELLDNRYLSFDPYNVDDIINKITSFIDKPKKFNYANLLKKYSFKRMTEETVNIYHQLT